MITEGHAKELTMLAMNGNQSMADVPSRDYLTTYPQAGNSDNLILDSNPSRPYITVYDKAP